MADAFLIALDHLGFIVLGTILPLMAAFFFYCIRRGWILGDASEGWPAAKGTILESQVTVESNEGSTYEVPRIRYEYEVDSNLYQGHVISFRGTWGGLSAEQYVAKHPAGGKVVVYYAPEEPGTSVLERGAADPGILLPGLWGTVGTFCVGIGMWVVVIYQVFFAKR